MSPFIAVIRRLPGGAFAKMPKSRSMPAVPTGTAKANFKTYFVPWPKGIAQFLMYGSPRVLRTSSPQQVDHQQRRLMSTVNGKHLNGSGVNGNHLNGSGVNGTHPQDEEDFHIYGPGTVASKEDAVAANPDAHTMLTAQDPQKQGVRKTNDAANLKTPSTKPLGLGGIMQRFRKGQKLSMVTAYDFPSARFARGAGVELVLVGDSIGNCRLGLPDTVGVTMDDMLRATTSVRRGVDAAPNAWGCAGRKPLVVGDMPFGSYLFETDALKNAAAFRMVGADMVKLEGGRRVAHLVRALTDAGIGVMAHIGLEPQRAAIQGLKLQGTTAPDAVDIVRDAQALAAAGATSMVVECVPEEVGRAVQDAVSIPVIGIGAGGDVAGQVLVCDDLLGLHGTPPSFAKAYLNLAKACAEAYAAYVSEVRAGAFPGSYARHMKPEELARFRASLAGVGVDSTTLEATVGSKPQVDLPPTRAEHQQLQTSKACAQETPVEPTATPCFPELSPQLSSSAQTV